MHTIVYPPPQLGCTKQFHHLQEFPFAPLLSTLHFTFSFWQLIICVCPYILPSGMGQTNVCPGLFVFVYDSGEYESSFLDSSFNFSLYIIIYIYIHYICICIHIYIHTYIILNGILFHSQKCFSLDNKLED